LAACGRDDEPPVEITLALAKTSLMIPADELEPKDISFTSSGGEWAAAFNVKWLRAEKVNNETLRVSYDANTEPELREGIVTASIGDVSGTLTVTQAGAPAETEPENTDTTDDNMEPENPDTSDDNTENK